MSDTLERLRGRVAAGAFFEAEQADYEAVLALLDIAEAAQGWIYWYENGGGAAKALAGIKESLAALDSTGGAER